VLDELGALSEGLRGFNIPIHPSHLTFFRVCACTGKTYIKIATLQQSEYSVDVMIVSTHALAYRLSLTYTY